MGLKSFLGWLNDRMGVPTLGDDWSIKTMDEAISIPAIRACLGKITSAIAQVPFQLNMKIDDGWAPALNHRWYYSTKYEPNRFQCHFDFFEDLLASAIMYGDGRAYIDEGNLELFMLPFSSTATVWQGGEKYHVTKVDRDDPIWRFEDGHETNQKNVLVFRDEEVIHIRGMSSDTLTGSGVLDCKQTFSIAADSENHLATQLRKGFSGRIMLEAPAGVFRSQEDAEKFLEGFQKRHAGTENSGKVGMLREGIKANLIQMSNTDGQIVELRRFTREDIALLFQLETILGQDKSVSYSSAEQKNQQEVRNCFMRWVKKISQEFWRKLLTAKERRKELYCFDFDFSDYLKPDAAAETNRLIALRNAAVISANEVRYKLGMNLSDDPTADKLMNPATTANMQTANETEEMPEDADEQEDDAEAMGQKAVESMLRNLISTEANRIRQHAAKPDKFVSRIESFYSKWEGKLADKLEEVGLDRQRATDHCERSRELIDDCLDLGADKFTEAVSNRVASWPDRVHFLINGEE